MQDSPGHMCTLCFQSRTVRAICVHFVFNAGQSGTYLYTLFSKQDSPGHMCTLCFQCRTVRDSASCIDPVTQSIQIPSAVYSRSHIAPSQEEFAKNLSNLSMVTSASRKFLRPARVVYIDPAGETAARPGPSRRFATDK